MILHNRFTDSSTWNTSSFTKSRWRWLNQRLCILDWADSLCLADRCHGHRGQTAGRRAGNHRHPGQSWHQDLGPDWRQERFRLTHSAHLSSNLLIDLFIYFNWINEWLWRLMTFWNYETVFVAFFAITSRIIMDCPTTVEMKIIFFLLQKRRRTLDILVHFWPTIWLSITEKMSSKMKMIDFFVLSMVTCGDTIKYF